MKKAVTLKDVAKKANVSFKTVSRVVNNESGVSENTASKVRSIIEELEYYPNINAKSIRTRKSQVFGLITDQIATTPYAVDIIKGAQNAASKQNKLLFVVNTGIDDVFNKKVVDMLLQRHVEGIIFAAMYHKKIEIPASLSKRANFVLVNCYCDDPYITSIVPDEFNGGYEATKKLIEKGHKKIAMLNLPNDSIAAELRLQGYRKALKDHGLVLNEKYIKTAVIRKKSGEVNIAYNITLNLLDMANRPTGIFSANDRIAMKVYDAIKSKGLSIPGDVSVIGFDNQEIIAENIHPGLSTMALPHREMGLNAVEVLSGDYTTNKTNGSTNNQIMLRCQYVERKSI